MLNLPTLSLQRKINSSRLMAGVAFYTNVLRAKTSDSPMGSITKGLRLREEDNYVRNML